MKHDEELAREVINCFLKEIMIAPASRGHHNNFKGGLIKHLENTLEFAKKYFPKEDKLHFLALIHDIGKAREYEIKDDKIYFKFPPVDHIIHTIDMLKSLDIDLDDEELNAIQMHHGGWSPFKGDLCQLAIKLHFCDMMAVNREVGLK